MFNVRRLAINSHTIDSYMFEIQEGGSGGRTASAKSLC